MNYLNQDKMNEALYIFVRTMEIWFYSNTMI